MAHRLELGSLASQLATCAAVVQRCIVLLPATRVCVCVCAATVVVVASCCASCSILTAQQQQHTQFHRSWRHCSSAPTSSPLDMLVRAKVVTQCEPELHESLSLLLSLSHCPSVDCDCVCLSVLFASLCRKCLLLLLLVFGANFFDVCGSFLHQLSFRSVHLDQLLAFASAASLYRIHHQFLLTLFTHFFKVFKNFDFFSLKTFGLLLLFVLTSSLYPTTATPNFYSSR